MQTVLTILSPLLSDLLQIGLAGLLALLMWAVKRAADWLKLSNDSQVRTYLIQAVENAVVWAETEARKRLPERKPGDPMPLVGLDAREQIIASAAAYVADRVPDALKHFGIDADGLRQLVQTRLSPI